MDRISNLPDFIAHHIMSYLSAKEVARTSILSKRWKYLQTSFPVLDFCESYEHFVGEELAFREPGGFDTIEMAMFCLGIIEFIDYVDASLLRFCELKFSMLRCRLWMVLLNDNQMNPVLDKWIEQIIKSEVKDIDFHFQSDENVKYTLPQILFNAKSVITLNLGGCNLEQPPDSMRLHSLKIVTLTQVCISAEMLQKLTSQCTCPLLEELYLSDCQGFKHICVVKACKLKIISICGSPDELERVEISVLSLQQFVLSSEPVRGSIAIEMAGCPNLKVLQFSGFAFKDREFRRLISKFPLLENLNINACDLLEQITISSNLLRDLHISHCFNLKEIDVDTPNLQSFSYVNHPILISSINAPCPWKVSFMNEVRQGNAVAPDTQWYLNVRKFLGVSNEIEELAFCITSDMNSFSFDEFRKSSHSLPCEATNLYLQSHETIPPSTYAALLDGVLGICYPKHISLPRSHETDDFIKWLYEQMTNRDTNCCNSHDIKCWRHYLKDYGSMCSIPNKDEKPLEDDTSGTFCLHLDWCFPPSVDKA
ncbi:hypothetical protein ACOSP7_020473 [Xanthoceras sorbifolium]